jgi:hypothetical protein
MAFIADLKLRRVLILKINLISSCDRLEAHLLIRVTLSSSNFKYHPKLGSKIGFQVKIIL